MTGRLQRQARALLRSREGSLSVELVLIAPILCLLLAFAVDGGRFVLDWTEVRGAARAGADFALRYPSNMEGIRAATLGAANIDVASAAVATEIYCECPDSGNIATTRVDCAATCTTGSIRSYVSVGVSQGFTPIFDYHASILPRQVGAQAVIRAR